MISFFSIFSKITGLLFTRFWFVFQIYFDNISFRKNICLFLLVYHLYQFTLIKTDNFEPILIKKTYGSVLVIRILLLIDCCFLFLIFLIKGPKLFSVNSLNVTPIFRSTEVELALWEHNLRQIFQKGILIPLI